MHSERSWPGGPCRASALRALIDARTFDVGETVMPDTWTLGAYLFDTTGGMFALAADILGAEGEKRDVVVETAARAYGLVPRHA